LDERRDIWPVKTLAPTISSQLGTSQQKLSLSAITAGFLTFLSRSEHLGSRKDMAQTAYSLLHGSSFSFWPFESSRVRPNHASSKHTSSGWTSQLTATALNQLSQQSQ